MNEIYELLLNIQEIAKANNLFLQSFEARLSELEKKMTIDTKKSEPTAAGAEKIKAKEE